MINFPNEEQNELKAPLQLLGIGKWSHMENFLEEGDRFSVLGPKTCSNKSSTSKAWSNIRSSRKLMIIAIHSAILLPYGECPL